MSGRGRKRKYLNAAESAEAKKARDRARQARLVDVGDERQRWSQLAAQAGCTRDCDFAKLLLDRYEVPPALVEVAAPVEAPAQVETCPKVNITTQTGPDPERDDDETLSYGEMSLDEPEVTLYRPTEESMFEYTQDQRINEKTYNQEQVEDLEELEPDECVHHLQPDRPDDPVDPTSFIVLGGPDEALQEVPCMAYLSCLQALAPDLSCQQCGKSCQKSTKHVGSAVIFVWTCENGHVARRWSSQPRLKKQGLNLADFMMATNILLSGNNYAKIALLFRFLGMRIVSQRTFSDIQRLYCVPAIQSFWDDVNSATLNRFQGQPLIVAGDGRNDSPGHSSQYCTYTLMEHDSNSILSVQVVDKREVQGKSTNMEKLGAELGLRHVLDAGVEIAQFVTDAHVQIGALMKKDEFSNILHQLDMWHGAKNLKKRLYAVADKKGNEALKEWVPDITNHFWYCCSKANGDEIEFMGRWRGVIHHVAGLHEWSDGQLTDPVCEHEPMEEPTGGKTWLEAESPAHVALHSALYDKTFLRKVKYYTHFRHTGALEVFHQHMLMYVAKRFAFSPPVYKARTLLAALDFHLHADRELKTDAQGNTVYRRMYNKRTKSWFAIKMREPKSYHYITDLQRKVLETRESVPGPLKQKAQLSATDPRRISSTLAMEDPPALSVLVERHVSRGGSSQSQP